MANLSDRIKTIEEQVVGQTDNRVLLVEGVDDVDAFNVFLSLSSEQSLQKKWVIAQAGSKKLVLDILHQRPEWFGVVDSDEWTPKQIEQVRQSYQNLWILPRYCLENYLIVPSEIEAALPQVQKLKIEQYITEQTPDIQSVLNQRFGDKIDMYIAHGVLWHIVNPLWSGIRNKGFVSKLLHNPEIAGDEDKLRQVLEDWHDHLAPGPLLAQFQAKLAEVNQLPLESRMHHWVHGKAFYKDVVHPTLNLLLGQQSEKVLKRLLFRHGPVHSDFHSLWQALASVR